MIEIVKADCVDVTREDFDGGQLRLYATNNCGVTLRYLEWHYQIISPNGTIVNESWTNSCPIPRRQHDRAECVFGARGLDEVPIDDRGATLRVWATRRP